MDDWDDNVTNSNNLDDNESSNGKSYGKGRGFTPRGLDGDDRRGRGGRGGRGGDRRGGFGGRGGGGRRNDDNENGDWGGGRRNRDEGNDQNNDWGSGGGRRNDRNNDDWNGGGGGGGGGGGWGSENNDGEGRGGGRGRGRGRGGRDGDRGRRGDDGGFGGDSGGFNDGDEGGEEGEKRPPIYVPEEITEDEINTQGVSVGINFKDYDNIKINISGENPPKPIRSFPESGLRSIILDNLKFFKYDQPTPVQKHAIPIVLEKRDLMATAQTGSGKTAAFLLPIIHCLLENQEDLQNSSYCEPKALILSPTRELTTQIYTEAKKFCKGSILRVAQIYGGTAVSYQLKLMEGAHILVATPGRLGDYLGKGKLVLSGIRYMVLDEADRMLDMGFKSEIEKFFSHETISHQGDRQTLMFSATFNPEVQKLAANFLNNYVFLAVGIVGGACKDVEQMFIQAGRAEKKKKLEELLKSEPTTKGTLLFVETKRNADFIASYLSDKDFPTTSIHGDRFQQQREEALRDFKSGRKNILVATSVAARGLDIKGVKHVINYDIPKSIDEYVHRIGRTGRLGNKGKATSFYDSGEDNQIASGLVTILEQAGQQVPEWLKQDAGSAGGGYENNEFGGYDFRSSNNDNFKTGDGNQPQEIAGGEEW